MAGNEQLIGVWIWLWTLVASHRAGQLEVFDQLTSRLNLPSPVRVVDRKKS